MPVFQARDTAILPLSKMRSTIAKRMVQSTNEMPHFFTTTAVDVSELMKLRKNLKELPGYEGLTFNHMILKACGMALHSYPRINSSFSPDGIIQHGEINVGIVTALDDGLLIPVVKDANFKSLSDIVSDAHGLVQRARAGKPKGEDLSGGTFTISNMGRYDVESFNAIINPGQGSILAVAPIQQEPIVRDGEIKVGNVCRLTLSVDHRIIDGVMCGEFLSDLKKILETPALILA